MAGKTARWESELWSYLSLGDGIHCPLYDFCQLKQEGIKCLSDEIGKEDIDRIQKFIDDDEIDWSSNDLVNLELPRCPGSSRIFQLVVKLAWKYRGRSWDNHLPVPDDLILRADDNLPIEVRRVPLKVYHGAIWRLSNCWVIQLNSYDTPARQRFTLYHEIFHVLAHCRAMCSFKKRKGQEGLFNEILADHFAANILLPGESVVSKWTEVQDVNRMAAIFNVPESVMYIGLRSMRLI